MNEKGLTKNDSLCLKGIAIILMLFYHLFGFTERFENFEVSFFPFSQNFVVSISLLCKICVSIFAFVTGYGLLKSIEKTPINKTDVAKWNIKRLIKTMSGFYFIYVISFIATQLLSELPEKTYFGGSFVKGLVYMATDFLGLSNLFGTPTLLGTWWYMSAAIIFILLIPVFYFLSRKTGYLPILIIIIAAPHLLNTGYPGGMSTYIFIPSVIIGMMFAEYNIFEKIQALAVKKGILSYTVVIAVLLMLCICSYFVSINIDYFDFWEIEHSIIPISFICFFRYCIVRIPVIKQILAFLGKHSMTIFLTHTFIRYNYLNDFVYSFGNFIKIYAVLFVLSVALAVVIDTAKQLIKFDRFVDKFTAFALNRIDSILK